MTSITQDLLEAQSQNETNATLLKSKADRLVENDMLVVSYNIESFVSNIT